MAHGPIVAGVVVFIFAAASFFFALAETALFSLTKWQARQLAERSPGAGGMVLRLLAAPQDLLVIDLASVFPDLRYRRLRGRVDGNRVVPYFARSDIESETAPLKGLELAWVDDPVATWARLGRM